MVKKIVFLGMGGTIAGKASDPGDNVGYKAAQVGVQDLLAGIPGLDRVLGAYLAASEQVMQLDSKDMSAAAWGTLVQRASLHLADSDVAGVVVTHGTDTLEETGYLLTRALPGTLLAQKPVVLTCAMRPASSQFPDGPQNLLDAASAACAMGAHGVTVVCAGEIHDARHVRKVHPYRLNPFSSGERGPVGVVEEGNVRLLHDWPMSDAKSPAPVGSAWPRVEIVVSYAGCSGAMVRSLLAHPGEVPVQGIVVAGTGNGSIHQDLEEALMEAQASGVRVVRSTRCALGQIVGGRTDDSGPFAYSAQDPFKARIDLMLELMVCAPAMRA